MAYATEQDIIALRGAAALETLLPIDATPAVAIARALDDATAMIAPYLAKRYHVTPGAASPILRLCAVDIACWQLASAADRLTEEIDKRAKLRFEFLKDVAAGRADIAELEQAEAAGLGGGGADGDAYFEAQPRRFGSEP